MHRWQDSKTYNREGVEMREILYKLIFGETIAQTRSERDRLEEQLTKETEARREAQFDLANLNMEFTDVRAIDHNSMKDMKSKIKILRAVVNHTGKKEEWVRRAELNFIISRFRLFLTTRLNKDVHPSVFWKWLYEMEGLVSKVEKSYYDEDTDAVLAGIIAKPERPLTIEELEQRYGDIL